MVVPHNGVLFNCFSVGPYLDSSKDDTIHALRLTDRDGGYMP